MSSDSRRDALQRYSMVVTEGFGKHLVQYATDPNGEWVRYADVAALRSSVQEEPAARAVAINDALDTGLAVHLRKARAFLEGVSDQLEQAEYCASTLQPSSDARAVAPEFVLDHEIGERLGALTNRLMVTTEFGKDAHTVLDAGILLTKALEAIVDREKKLDAIAGVLDYPRESWRISGCDNLAHAVKTLQDNYIALRDALPQSAQNNAEAQHEVGNTQPEHGAAVSGPAAASAPFARNDTQRSECKHPQCRNDSGDCEGRCAELDRAEDFRVLNQQRCAEAMQLLYQTYIIDAKIAEDRGHAIQAINRMILALGGEDTAAKIEAVPYTARLLESGEPELVQLAKDLKGAI